MQRPRQNCVSASYLLFEKVRERLCKLNEAEASASYLLFEQVCEDERFIFLAHAPPDPQAPA